MSLRNSLTVRADQVPCIFRTTFGNIDYHIGINYNEVGNFYTVDLYDTQMKPLVLGEKMVLNQRLFSEETSPKIPMIPLVPMDEAGKEKTITPENFGKTVFIYLDTLPYTSGDINTAFIEDDRQFGGDQ